MCLYQPEVCSPKRPAKLNQASLLWLDRVYKKTGMWLEGEFQVNSIKRNTYCAKHAPPDRKLEFTGSHYATQRVAPTHLMWIGRFQHRTPMLMACLNGSISACIQTFGTCHNCALELRRYAQCGAAVTGLATNSAVILDKISNEECFRSLKMTS